MRGFFFRKIRAKEKLAVVFDIGSASVGAALVVFSAHQLPHIVYTTRKEIPVSKALSASELVLKMIAVLREVARNVAKEGFPRVAITLFGTLKPHIVFYALASPWHISQVRIVKKKDTEPFQITEQLIRDLLFQDLGEFRTAYEEYAKSSRTEDTQEIIEGDILDIRLNRYETDTPVGKVARNFEMTLFASSASRELIEQVESAGHTLFTHAESRFASFTSAFFTVVRDLYHEKRNYLLLDISGEVSDLSLVKDGRIIETISFPAGRNAVIRRIANSFNVSISEAESLLNLYYKEHLMDAERNRLKKILADSETEWLRFFTKELKEISSQILLPRDVFLTADEPLKKWFQEILSSDQLSSSITSSGKPFAVTALDGKTLEQKSGMNLYAHTDPFLVVETLFLNKKINVV